MQPEQPKYKLILYTVYFILLVITTNYICNKIQQYELSKNAGVRTHADLCSPEYEGCYSGFDGFNTPGYEPCPISRRLSICPSSGFESPSPGFQTGSSFDYSSPRLDTGSRFRDDSDYPDVNFGDVEIEPIRRHQSDDIYKTVLEFGLIPDRTRRCGLKMGLTSGTGRIQDFGVHPNVSKIIGLTEDIELIGGAVKRGGEAGDGIKSRESAEDGIKSGESAGDGRKRRESDGDGIKSRESAGDGIKSSESAGDGIKSSESAGDGIKSGESAGDGRKRRESAGDGIKSRESAGYGIKSSESAGDGIKSCESAGDGIKSSESAGDGIKNKESAGDGRKSSESAGDGIKNKESAGDGRKSGESAEDGIKSSELAGDRIKSSESAGDREKSSESVGDGIKSSQSAGDGIKSSESAGDGIKSSESAGDEIKSSESAGDGIKSCESAGDGIKSSESAGDGIKSSESAGDEKKRNESARDGVKSSESAGNGLKSGSSGDEKKSKASVGKVEPKRKVSNRRHFRNALGYKLIEKIRSKYRGYYKDPSDKEVMMNDPRNYENSYEVFDPNEEYVNEGKYYNDMRDYDIEEIRELQDDDYMQDEDNYEDRYIEDDRYDRRNYMHAETNEKDEKFDTARFGKSHKSKDMIHFLSAVKESVETTNVTANATEVPQKSQLVTREFGGKNTKQPLKKDAENLRKSTNRDDDSSRCHEPENTPTICCDPDTCKNLQKKKLQPDFRSTTPTTYESIVCPYKGSKPNDPVNPAKQGVHRVCYDPETPPAKPNKPNEPRYPIDPVRNQMDPVRNQMNPVRNQKDPVRYSDDPSIYPQPIRYPNDPRSNPSYRGGLPEFPTGHHDPECPDNSYIKPSELPKKPEVLVKTRVKPGAYKRPEYHPPEMYPDKVEMDAATSINKEQHEIEQEFYHTEVSIKNYIDKDYVDGNYQETNQRCVCKPDFHTPVGYQPGRYQEPVKYDEMPRKYDPPRKYQDPIEKMDYQDKYQDSLNKPEYHDNDLKSPPKNEMTDQYVSPQYVPFIPKETDKPKYNEKDYQDTECKCPESDGSLDPDQDRKYDRKYQDRTYQENVRMYPDDDACKCKEENPNPPVVESLNDDLQPFEDYKVEPLFDMYSKGQQSCRCKKPEEVCKPHVQICINQDRKNKTYRKGLSQDFDKDEWDDTVIPKTNCFCKVDTNREDDKKNCSQIIEPTLGSESSSLRNYPNPIKTLLGFSDTSKKKVDTNLMIADENFVNDIKSLDKLCRFINPELFRMKKGFQDICSKVCGFLKPGDYKNVGTYEAESIKKEADLNKITAAVKQKELKADFDITKPVNTQPCAIFPKDKHDKEETLEKRKKISKKLFKLFHEPNSESMDEPKPTPKLPKRRKTLCSTIVFPESDTDKDYEEKDEKTYEKKPDYDERDDKDEIKDSEKEDNNEKMETEALSGKETLITDLKNYIKSFSPCKRICGLFENFPVVKPIRTPQEFIWIGKSKGKTIKIEKSLEDDEPLKIMVEKPDANKKERPTIYKKLNHLLRQIRKQKKLAISNKMKRSIKPCSAVKYLQILNDLPCVATAEKIKPTHQNLCRFTEYYQIPNYNTDGSDIEQASLYPKFNQNKDDYVIVKLKRKSGYDSPANNYKVYKISEIPIDSRFLNMNCSDPYYPTNQNQKQNFISNPELPRSILNQPSISIDVESKPTTTPESTQNPTTNPRPNPTPNLTSNSISTQIFTQKIEPIPNYLRQDTNSANNVINQVARKMDKLQKKINKQFEKRPKSKV